jgi:hypothetical protein
VVAYRPVVAPDIDMETFRTDLKIENGFEVGGGSVSDLWRRCHIGRPAEAGQCLRSALVQTGSFQWSPVQMVVPVGLSLLCADEGQAERAVELFALASRYGCVANSRWFQDIVGKTLTEARTHLQ